MTTTDTTTKGTKVTPKLTTGKALVETLTAKGYTPSQVERSLRRSLAHMTKVGTPTEKKVFQAAHNLAVKSVKA
jgi:hypothetical protein